MKKILFASTALVASAGFAAAEISFSGEAGIGVIYDGTDWAANHYTTLSVSMAGETDGGLSFGASFDITTGTTGGAVDASSAYIEGGFGKLSAGDIDNAVDATVGGLADVGYSGLGVDNLGETQKGTSGADFLYQGSFGDFSVAASAQLDGGSDWAIAAGYSMGDYKFAAGVEDAAGDTVYAISAGASFGDFGVNALFAKNSDTSAESYGIDATYAMGATSVTVAYGNDGTDEAFGLGIGYDLGGGASVNAGVAEVAGTTVADLGIIMTF
ncbi:porin [Aliiroseovarius marinus]|uniref:porin n=1 Tax=Aliiroseovarius marinus TaxID=2500159 RepID=UPI00105E99EB|nr:porin [Aliiroseovarius marinus]